MIWLDILMSQPGSYVIEMIDDIYNYLFQSSHRPIAKAC